MEPLLQTTNPFIAVQSSVYVKHVHTQVHRQVLPPCRKAATVHVEAGSSYKNVPKLLRQKAESCIRRSQRRVMNRLNVVTELCLNISFLLQKHHCLFHSLTQTLNWAERQNIKWIFPCREFQLQYQPGCWEGYFIVVKEINVQDTLVL